MWLLKVIPQGIISQEVNTLMFGLGSLTETWNLLVRLGRLARKSLEPACLLHFRITGTQGSTQFLYGCWGLKSGSYYHLQAIYCLSHLPHPSRYTLILLYSPKSWAPSDKFLIGTGLAMLQVACVLSYSLCIGIIPMSAI